MLGGAAPERHQRLCVRHRPRQHHVTHAVVGRPQGAALGAGAPRSPQRESGRLGGRLCVAAGRGRRRRRGGLRVGRRRLVATAAATASTSAVLEELDCEPVVALALLDDAELPGALPALEAPPEIAQRVHGQTHVERGARKPVPRPQCAAIAVMMHGARNARRSVHCVCQNARRAVGAVRGGPAAYRVRPASRSSLSSVGSGATGGCSSARRSASADRSAVSNATRFCHTLSSAYTRARRACRTHTEQPCESGTRCTECTGRAVH